MKRGDTSKYLSYLIMQLPTQLHYMTDYKIEHQNMRQEVRGKVGNVSKAKAAFDLERHGQGSERSAVSVFKASYASCRAQELQGEGFDPDEFSVTAAIHACEKAGAWQWHGLNLVVLVRETDRVAALCVQKFPNFAVLAI